MNKLIAIIAAILFLALAWADHREDLRRNREIALLQERVNALQLTVPGNGGIDMVIETTVVGLPFKKPRAVKLRLRY